MMRTEDAAALVPAGFTDFVARHTAEAGAVDGPSGADWARALPHLLAEALDAWSLEPAGPTRTGWTAVVVPVSRDAEPLALKVVWPHIEARDEAVVLRHWDGDGAVRLVAADPTRGALLLERLEPGRDLTGVDIDTACAVAGGLMRRLHVPAAAQLRTLTDFATHHTRRVAGDDSPLPRRMRERTAGRLADLLSDPGVDATIIHCDLHYENVLGSLRGGTDPWLAIDPHALAGHPGFEFVPLLRNRVEELGAGSSLRWSVRRRIEVAAEAAGVEEDVAIAWSYVGTAIEAGWAASDGDDEALTFCVSLLKALDD